MNAIILAFSHEATSHKLKQTLESTGMKVFKSCQTKWELMAAASNAGQGIIITGYKFSNELAENIMMDLPEGFLMLVITPPSQGQYIQNKSMFVLPSPVNKVSLITSLEILMQMQSVDRRTMRPREESKIIGQAKAVLMEHEYMTEDQAYRYIQKSSMDAGLKLWQMAEKIIAEHS